MRELLNRAEWRGECLESFDDRIFLPADVRIGEELSALWRKYSSELADLTAALRQKHDSLRARGYNAAFGDVEGEFLYIMIRELRPELVYEISPNAGSSTNYILAAVTRNGTGRVEGFELEAQLNGVPTAQVIASNQIELCDFARYRLNVGDARRTVPERLKAAKPDFCLIDSWHEDIFAEFYVHHLLPNMRGTVLIQDMAHFDPRPEWATEAYYLLNHMQMTGSNVVPIASYEDDLAAVRGHLTPRRARRSNSILVHLGDAPPSSPALPGERYKRAWQGQADDARPAFCDLLAVALDRAPMTKRMIDAMAGGFDRLDPCCQVLALHALTKGGASDIARRLLPSLAVDNIRGPDLLVRVARSALKLGIEQTLTSLAARIRTAALDPQLPTGYRHLIELAELQLEAGQRAEAEASLATALDMLKTGQGSARSKWTRELAEFCLRHPAQLPKLWRTAGHPDAIRGALSAGRTMLRSVAVRTVRQVRGR